MDILISFKATVGAVGTLRTVKEVTFDVINHSLVLWLKNKKFPTSWADSVSNRDVNSRLPPGIPAGLQYSFAYVGGIETIVREQFGYDLYVVESGIEGGESVVSYPALFTSRYESTDDGFSGANGVDRQRWFETITAMPEPPYPPGMELLDVFYYENDGYTVNGSYAQKEAITESRASDPRRISLSWYEQYHANMSPPPSSYQYSSGVDQYGKPWEFKEIKTWRRRVYFAND